MKNSIDEHAKVGNDLNCLHEGIQWLLEIKPSLKKCDILGLL